MEVIDRNSRKVLKATVKLWKSNNFAESNPDDRDIQKELPKMKQNEIQSSLSFLASQDLLTYDIARGYNDEKGHSSQIFIIKHVSYYAGVFTELEWLRFKNGILIPALVSLIVSLIYNAITNR